MSMLVKPRIPGARCAGAVDEFENGAIRRVRVGRRWVAVFRSRTRFYALEDRCPHEGTPLSAGSVGDREVRCPSHALTFDLASGLCTKNDVFRVRSYRVVVLRGKIWVLPRRQPPPWRPRRTERAARGGASRPRASAGRTNAGRRASGAKER